MRGVTYKCVSAEEVGDVLALDVVHESSAAFIVLAPVNEELPACVLINEWADECPEDGEDSRGTNDQEESHRLGVVGLDDLDDV